MEHCRNIIPGIPRTPTEEEKTLNEGIKKTIGTLRADYLREKAKLQKAKALEKELEKLRKKGRKEGKGGRKESKAKAKTVRATKVKKKATTTAKKTNKARNKKQAQPKVQPQVQPKVQPQAQVQPQEEEEDVEQGPQAIQTSSETLQDIPPDDDIIELLYNCLHIPPEATTTCSDGQPAEPLPEDAQGHPPTTGKGPLAPQVKRIPI